MNGADEVASAGGRPSRRQVRSDLEAQARLTWLLWQAFSDVRAEVRRDLSSRREAVVPALLVLKEGPARPFEIAEVLDVPANTVAKQLADFLQDYSAPRYVERLESGTYRLTRLGHAAVDRWAETAIRTRLLRGLKAHRAKPRTAS